MTGAVLAGGAVVFHVNVAEAEVFAGSLTVTVTVLVEAASRFTFPLIKPVVALMLKPMGRPVAE